MQPVSRSHQSRDARNNRDQDEVDVLVIGGRVAGASLALLLAQRGYRVLMVDRDHFPSDCLSTHYMTWRYVRLLADLGVLADVEAAGFRRVTRSRTWVEDCLFEGPTAPGGGYALAPRRDTLDAILIEHAQRHGAEFWERTRAEALINDDGRVVGAQLVARGGSTCKVLAKVVVGADGRHSKVAEWVDASRYQETPALRPAYYGYFHGLEPLDETAVELFCVNDRLGFIFPMQPGIDCLALELQPEDFQSCRADPRARFETDFRRLPTMARRMANIELEGKMLGVHGVANFFRKPYGAGWALTGDAAYLKDPITGTGIGDALVQAFLLAPALDAALGGADWETTMASYQQQRDAQLGPGFDFTVSAAKEHDPSPDQLAWTRAVLAVPHLTRTMTGVLPAALPESMPAVQQPLLRLLAQGFSAASAPTAASAIRE
jgi:flavin-dependent dehydrogenase